MIKNSKEYENWSETYHNKEVVDLKKHFTEKDLETLKKLGIKILDKIYTEYEFELLNMLVIKYYKDDDLSKEELELCSDLEPTGVSQEELEKLIEKINKINLIYNF